MIRVCGPLFLVYSTTLAPLAKAPNLVLGITRSQALVSPYGTDRMGKRAGLGYDDVTSVTLF